MYPVRTERKVFEKLVDLGGVAERSRFTVNENQRLARIARKTSHVRRMRDGRWEVTAAGWERKNYEDGQKLLWSEEAYRQEYYADLVAFRPSAEATT